jgi:hypothetical protein
MTSTGAPPSAVAYDLRPPGGGPRLEAFRRGVSGGAAMGGRLREVAMEVGVGVAGEVEVEVEWRVAAGEGVMEGRAQGLRPACAPK